MLTSYIAAAMRQARYKLLTEDGIFFGEIPKIDGVWATAPTLDDCRDELAEVLEEWIVLSLARNLPIPEIGGVSLAFRKVS